MKCLLAVFVNLGGFPSRSTAWQEGGEIWVEASVAGADRGVTSEWVKRSRFLSAAGIDRADVSLLETRAADAGCGGIDCGHEVGWSATEKSSALRRMASTFCNRTRRSKITSAANASAQAGMIKSSNAFAQPFPTPEHAIALTRHRSSTTSRQLCTLSLAFH